MVSEPQEEKDYWSLLQSSQKQFYPDFINHLSTQVDATAEEGRAAVIEFHDDAKPSIKPLLTSRNLRRYIDRTSSGAVYRRVFVLEGLPRNFVQVLGAKLRVPPSFFAAHWFSPGAYVGNLVNRNPRHHDYQDRCILSFPKLHQAIIKEKDGNATSDRIYHMESSAYRPISRLTVFGDYDGPLSSSEKFSFWSSREGETWDVVILVDPPLGNFVRWKTSPVPREVDHSESIQLAHGIMDGGSQKGSWYPPYKPDAALSPTSAEWPTTSHSPGMRSFFDDILILSSITNHHPISYPKETLRICREIILMAWTAWLRITEAQIIQEQVKMYTGTEIADHDHPTTSSWQDTSWTLPWKQRQFSRLIRAKTKLEALDADLYRSMDALGIITGGTGSEVEAWEADAWRALRKEVEILKTRLEIMSQAYTQAVAVRESITANEQARQVGLLTSLATLFIPVSFVATIFSMGGLFAAGERLFWVYWVIAVPIVTFSCFLMFTQLGRLVWRRGAASDGGKSLV